MHPRRTLPHPNAATSIRMTPRFPIMLKKASIGILAGFGVAAVYDKFIRERPVTGEK